IGELELDLDEYCLYRNGEPIKLMPKEIDLMAFLMRHPGQLFSAEALLAKVWHSHSEVSPDVVKVYIMKLRQKLDQKGQPSLISTVHGRGYRLDVDAGS